MSLKNSSILIVDDEEDIIEFLSFRLSQEGASIINASNGKECLNLLENIEAPDIIILDMMMPKMNGFEACKELRNNSKYDKSSIIMLSAQSDDEIQIKCLEVGADDYIIKPIKSKLLISKLKKYAKKDSISESGVFSYKNITLDKDKFLVNVDNKKIKLPFKEFHLLKLLLSKPDKVFGRDEILDEVWGKDVIVGDRTIDVHMRNLRKKIGKDYFETVKGVGYKFIAF